ncbi:MAG: GNAT family N-acetyltransferase [Acidobacteriota bacterium]|nr:GNAT family N-acetyltransferase [Acidobacteriota bacterium]
MARCLPTGDAEAEVISCVQSLKQLMEHEALFFRRWESTATPSFFLASLTPQWRPRVVVIRRGGQIEGVVYTKERRLGWINTGCVYIDAILPTIAGPKEQHASLLTRAIGVLLSSPTVRGIRVVAPTAWLNGLQIQERGVEEASRPIEAHTVLPLPRTYDDLVEALGPRGRRNIRYYRRKFEQAGGRFVSHMSDADFKAAATSILKSAGTGADAEKADRFLNMISAVDRPIRCGLQTDDGQWISILGGWHENPSATILFQMNNDVQYPRLSLGVLLKGYVLQNLIVRGTNNIFFWAGVGEPCDRLTKCIPATSFYLDKSDLFWVCLRQIVRWTLQFFPPEFRYVSEWIAPSVPCKADINKT